MPIEQKKLENLIAEKFPESKISVEDLAGDNNHYSVTIESSKFNGLSRIQQHQLVYQSHKLNTLDFASAYLPTLRPNLHHRF